MVDEPETTLDTEVVVLTEKEMVGEGERVNDDKDEFDDDWALTAARKANPRAAARKRG